MMAVVFGTTPLTMDEVETLVRPVVLLRLAYIIGEGEVS
jgi:hypothetical protein